MTRTALALFCLVTPAHAQQARPAQPTSEPPVTEPAAAPRPLPVVEQPGITIRYQRLPWSPVVFEALQAGKPTFADRVGPFAQMETTIALTVESTELPPGHYALVFFPNRGGKGAIFEIRRIKPGDFLEPGKIASLPAGEPVYRTPITWQSTTEATKTLEVHLASAQRQYSLVLNYGQWRFARTLHLVGAPASHVK